MAVTVEPLEHTGVGGLTLRGWSWTPKKDVKATVVLAHGKDEHVGRYGHVVEALTSAGFAVVAHDHRGHGRSEGPRGVIKRFDDYVDDLDGLVSIARSLQPSQPVILLGHSMGGLIATRYALQFGSRLDALVLSGPALSIGAGVPAWQKRLLLLVGRFFPNKTIPDSESGTLSRDPDVEKAFKTDPLCNNTPTKLGFARALYVASEETRPRSAEISLPLLVMHGAADKLTSPAGSQFLVDHATSSDKTLKLWPENRHEIFNDLDKDEVVAFTVDWIDSRF